MKKYLLLLMSLILSITISGQSISGTWQGVFYQEDCGQIATYYPASFDLNQIGNIVTGINRTEVDQTDYFILSELSNSTFDGVTFHYQISELIDQNPPPGGWCTNNFGNLTYNAEDETLIGPWEADMPCCPGILELYKLALLSDSIFCTNDLIEIHVTGQNVKWYSDEDLTDFLHMGNLYSPDIENSTTFFVTQTFYNTESPAISINIIINESPNVSLSLSKDTFCIDETDFLLSGGIPLNGVYSGIGVSNNIFNASIASEGSHIVTYSFINQFGCEEIASQEIIVIDCITDLSNSYSDIEIVIYPNPTVDFFNIEFIGIKGKKNIKIFNTHGKIIYNNNVNTNLLRIDNLDVGVYFVQLTRDQSSLIKRIIVF